MSLTVTTFYFFSQCSVLSVIDLSLPDFEVEKWLKTA